MATQRIQAGIEPAEYTRTERALFFVYGVLYGALLMGVVAHFS